MTIQTKVMMKKKKETSHSQTLRTSPRLTWSWEVTLLLPSDRHREDQPRGLSVMHRLFIS
jgi:hypothetical protein